MFLKIVGKAKGFHQICSRFVLAYGKLYDEMRIQKSQSFKLLGDFGCELEENLIYKAKCALQRHFEKLGQDSQKNALECLMVEVQKNIPKGAGLGGGSANAGVFLRQVNELYGFGLNAQELCKIASEVGSDVAFFASGEISANVGGRGEQVHSFVDSGWDKQEVEIYTPHIFCDTSAVYARFSQDIESCKTTYSVMPNEWLGMDSKHLLTQDSMLTLEALNDLFTPALRLYPELDSVRRELGDGWYFSGSGSSFFRLKSA